MDQLHPAIMSLNRFGLGEFVEREMLSSPLVQVVIYVICPEPLMKFFVTPPLLRVALTHPYVMQCQLFGL